MGYYPVFLEMKDRRCVVIGGGAVAERKVEGLVAAGANVTVISPGMTDGLKELLKQGAIRHVAREYQAGDRAGYDLFFVATDSSEINAVVFNEARSLRIWVNSADDPAHCPAANAWNRALQGDFRRLIREGRLVQAKELLLETLGAKS